MQIRQPAPARRTLTNTFTMQKLSVRESVQFGWNTFKQNPWMFVGTTAVIAVLQVVIGAVQESFDFFGVVASLVLSTLLYTGILNLYLKAHDAPKQMSFNHLWNPKPFWNYLGMSLLLLVIIGLGLILLIVPGVILAMVFFTAGYLVVDRRINPIQALKESARLTKGNRWKLFLLSLTMAGLMIIGMIPLFLGLLVTAPIAAMASVHAYRTLSKAPVVEAAA